MGALRALTSRGAGASVTRKIINHNADMDDFTHRYTDLACEYAQASHSDTRPRPTQMPVDGHRHVVARRRETHEDPVTGEETS